MSDLQDEELAKLAATIKSIGMELGFQRVAIADVDLAEDGAHLQRWLDLGRHGGMDYMHRHGAKRSRPAELVPGTVSVITARMDYWPRDAAPAEQVLSNPDTAYIARYALGRDYHKVLRGRLRKLAARVESIVGEFGYRVFTDSAPVLEKALARNAGLGWIGKHSNVLDREDGSWFFLGEIFTDLALPADTPVTTHCGSCTACLDICPTKAIVGPYEVDARRCISYLTIEHKGSIPVEFRKDMGNRIFGCDDCQLVCPWNRYAKPTDEPDFRPRHGLDSADLVTLFLWSEEEWLKKTEGSAIRRPGYEGWLRNLAVALGNAPTSVAVIDALKSRLDHNSAIVTEHVRWALNCHTRHA